MIPGAFDMLRAQFERLGCAGPPSEAECAALAETVTSVRTFPGRTQMVARGVPLDHSVLLLDGIVCRQSELVDGRRQILALHLPGDFVDLHGLLLKTLDHEVVSCSSARIAYASHDGLRRLTVDMPHLARKLWFVTTVDAAIHRQWIEMLARPAIERIAHLLCELQRRLAVVGRADPRGYDLPLTQTDLADATALTPVHVNRTLRHLRERGLVTIRSGRVNIADLAGLCRLARFDETYLYLDRGDL